VVTVPCGVTEGDRPVLLAWSFNGAPILPHMGVNVVSLGERSSILSIGAVTASHAGNYSCSATNEAGFDAFSATLVVKGVSSAQRMQKYNPVFRCTHVLYIPCSLHARLRRLVKWQMKNIPDI
jgi:Immunoglobulin domain